MTHLNSLEESPIVVLHQPAVQHNLQTTFCKSGNSETGVNTEYITCRELFVKSRFEKNWIYRFVSVFVYEVLNLIPHHTENLERNENLTFVLLHADDIKILTLASIWPLAPLVPPKGWLDTKESLAFKVFVYRARKEFDVCFTKVLVWKMITWTPHLVHIPNLAGDKSLLVKVVLNIASFESSEKIFQSLRFPRRIKLGYLETVKICVEVFPWCDVGRYSHRYFFVVQTLRS